jgi:hypothetical protein
LTFAGTGPGSGDVPTQCGDGSDAIVLFEGIPEVECSECTCDATGCELPALACFPQASCGGTPELINPDPGECATAPFGGCLSLSLAGDIGGSECTTSGGEPLEPEPLFDVYVAFCEGGQCGAGCASSEADCVVADGVVTECPAGFGTRYVLETGGEPQCAACDCASSCDGVGYESGLTSCTAIAIDSMSCDNPGYVSIFVHAVGGPSCTATPTGAVEGTFDLDDPRTVCCRDPLQNVSPT